MSHVESTARTGAQPVALVLTAALATGCLAGAAAGVIDGLWSWRAMAQYVPTVLGRTRALVYLASTYALGFSLAAVAAAGVWLLFWRGTRLPAITAALAAAHRRARERSPAEALTGLSLAIAGVPVLGGALALAYVVAWTNLATRKHPGLVVAVSMAAAIAALVVAAPVALLLGRAVELGLARLARRARWGRALSSPWAPVIAAAALLVLGALVACAATWETLSLLRLRPLWALLLVIALAAPAARVGARVARQLTGMRAAVRAAALGAAIVLPAAVALAAGAAEAPREAAVAHSAFGGPAARVLRMCGDLDRDGYSRFLGGGDCDDDDDRIHPRATEVPDDGHDNNCIGGDATAKATPPEPFGPLPGSVPADLNVLLVTIDTLRADHVGAYGYGRDTTPRLDEVAARGALFENAWAHAPSTRYSIPAILTGRYPLEVAALDIPGQWPGIQDENTTIAEVLAAQGLETGAVLNYWYFEKRRRMDQGFAHYDNSNARLHKGITGEGPAKTRGSSSREQTDKAIELLDRMAGRRFFLWVHYYDPHFDYERHPEVPSFGSRRIDLYDHEIRYTDHHIGRLLDDLQRRGLADRTVIVATGDHGEGFGEHGIDLHGYHLYAPQTKVPLVIRVPGLAPRRVTAPAGHVDILSTLAHLTGASPVPGTAGRSLVGAIAGDARAADGDRPVFQQLSYEGNHEMRGAATRQCHVIYNVSPDTSWEVYRIDRDPGETLDLSGAPGACRAVMDDLGAWYDQTEIPPGAAEALLGGPPGDIAAPLDVDLGDEARLLEVALPGGKVAPGARAALRFTFAARGALDDGWRVFVHVEPKSGGARFQGDHVPPRPPSWWRDGQFIRYTYEVPVPANARGRYRVWVGLFRGDERRPARGGSGVAIDHDRVMVGELEVGT